MRKALFIGGTGTISTAITAKIAKEGEWELWLLNRGNMPEAVPQGVNLIVADINDEAAVAAKLEGMQWDCVCDFIGFVPEHVERDIRLFAGRTKQYIFISSASAYQKPATSYIITEGTSLSNPYWQYSRDKIACEDRLVEEYRRNGFPVTIVRPSFTYGDRSVPMSIKGSKGCWQVLKRMLEGKPVIIQGDGTAIWTMTHNSDFAEAFVGLMGNSQAVGIPVHITSDEVLSWTQIYKAIADALGVELRPYYVASEWLASFGQYDFFGGLLGDKSVSSVFDNSRVKSLVPGFCAKMKFENGIRKTIENILAHPELQVEDPEFDKWCDDVIAVLEEAKIRFKERNK